MSSSKQLLNTYIKMQNDIISSLYSRNVLKFHSELEQSNIIEVPARNKARNKSNDILNLDNRIRSLIHHYLLIHTIQRAIFQVPFVFSESVTNSSIYFASLRNTRYVHPTTPIRQSIWPQLFVFTKDAVGVLF